MNGDGQLTEAPSGPCNVCGHGWPYHHDGCPYLALARERDALSARLSVLEGALRFYANEASYIRYEDGYMGPINSDVGHDHGSVARAALAGLGSDTQERKRVDPVVEAARAWWEGLRPTGWTEEQHRANPTVNCTNEPGKLLARVIVGLGANAQEEDV